MEEEKLVPVEVTEVEIKPDEETVVHKKDPEIADSGNEQGNVVIVESVDDQVKKDENCTDVADILKLKTEEFEEKAEQVLGEVTNGVSHYFNGVGGKTEADIVNGDSVVESLDSGVLNSETLEKLVDAEVPVEEKTEEIEAPIVEKVKEAEQTEIPIEEKKEEIAEKIIQICEEKNESTLREFEDKVKSTEADIQAKENIAEKAVDNDPIIEGSSLTSCAVDLPFEEIDESLKEKAEENKNVIERSTEVEISDPPIVSVTTRTIQPTSWRNCCGLFEVLRRSDRR